MKSNADTQEMQAVLAQAKYHQPEQDDIRTPLTPEIKDLLADLFRAYPMRVLSFGIVSHPLISSIFAVNKDKSFLLITPDNWDRVLEERIQMVNEFDTVEKVFWVALNKPFYLDILHFIAHRLDKRSYSNLLGSCWQDIEFPHQANLRDLTYMFKKALPNYLMDVKDFQQYRELSYKPDLPLYRGLQDTRAKRRGLSWTIDYDKASWFATRFHPQGKVLTATCDPRHRFAYFSGRGESEMVCNPWAIQITKEEYVHRQVSQANPD